MRKLLGFMHAIIKKIMLFGIKIMLIPNFFIDSYYGCSSILFNDLGNDKDFLIFDIVFLLMDNSLLIQS